MLSNQTTNSSYTTGQRRLLTLLAFACIYFIWGSTYLAIRYAVETIPPLFVAGLRHLIAGGLLFALVARFLLVNGLGWKIELEPSAILYAALAGLISGLLGALYPALHRLEHRLAVCAPSGFATRCLLLSGVQLRWAHRPRGLCSKPNDWPNGKSYPVTAAQLLPILTGFLAPIHFSKLAKNCDED